ncbi:NAC domain-containing protein 96-like isoform X2 [Cornus florida]|uniref:NAC domain-containing protein 96-like isoform X2 n=1 Tax=Cornus florida TaxID=4283 RepID=UPI00289A6BBF|nr:NAC domain-containing protein 96-like isoform X2 [Cornus florida]
MCPPVNFPPPDIGMYWSDQDVFMNLERGYPFPNNVLTDVNPYQYNPSKLPDGIWFYRCSEGKKDMEDGFWKARGEACEIFTNANISGWRTTLEFYEGQAGRKTDWVMQEYKITRKSPCKSSKPKESGSICRVFSSAGQSPKHEAHLEQGVTDTAGASHLQSVPAAVPQADNTSGKGSVSESQNWDNERGPFNVAETIQNFLEENLHDKDYISSGDYLSLDDFVDSECFNSDNSGRLSLSSDECFDPEAVVQLIDGNTNQDLRGRDANLNFSVSASVKPNEVVMRTATLGSLVSGNGNKSRPERTPRPDSSLPCSAIKEKIPNKGVPKHATKSQKADHRSEGRPRSDSSLPRSAIKEQIPDKGVPKHATKSHKADHRSEGTSKSCNVATSSSGHKPVSEGKKKAVVAKKKKSKRNYLCFLPF